MVAGRGWWRQTDSRLAGEAKTMTERTEAFDISTTDAWAALTAHQPSIEPLHLRQIFADDPDRGRELTVQAGDLYIDYAKHRVTRQTLDLLVDLAVTAGVEGRRDAMLRGDHINTNE